MHKFYVKRVFYLTSCILIFFIADDVIKSSAQIQQFEAKRGRGGRGRGMNQRGNRRGSMNRPIIRPNMFQQQMQLQMQHQQGV